MSKLFSNTLAAIVLAFPIAALADTTLSIPTGATLNLDTGKIVTTGGDISWDGTNINFVGSATGTDLPDSASSVYATLTSSTISYVAQGLSSAQITPSVNDLIIVKTNGGNYSKIQVNSVGSSLGITFDTFNGSTSGGGGGGTTSSGPTISSIVNNYSYIPTGFPNSGIAPGTIFVVFGSGMSQAPTGNVTLNSTVAPGLPKSWAGASLSVTVGNTTVQPAIYYATPGQIAAVLPSGTPTGSATLTVTYNGATSSPFSFQVVPAALGFNTYFGTGTGLLLAADNTTGAEITYTNSAKPGETLVFYGSGLGADTADSDTTFTTTPHAINTPLKVYIGGIAANVLYAGSSGYPGYNQIDVVVPDNVTTDCYVGVVAVTGSGSSATVSNFGSLAISASGGECTDSILGLSGGTLSSLSGQSTVNTGAVFVAQLISPTSTTNNTPQTNNFAFADFVKNTGSSYASSTGSSGSAFSVGSCFVTEVISSGGGSTTSNGLDAGSLTVTGPNGTYPMTSFLKGYYTASLPSNAITSSGGQFTFNNGSGGADIGTLSGATVTLPNPILTWTNQSSDATVSRGSGVTVNWSGGGSGTFVIISGSSTDSTTLANGTFICIAPQSALTFDVPSYVTIALPAGTGTLSVENGTSYGTFTAPHLDYGFKFGLTGVTINATYQ